MEDDEESLSEDADWALLVVEGRFCSIRSNASVKVSAASINFFSLNSFFPARSISSIRRCNALSSSAAVDDDPDVAAVVVEADEEDVLDVRATLDLVGVIPELSSNVSLGNDFDFFLAFFAVALVVVDDDMLYQTAAAVAIAAKPITMYVV